MFNVLKGALQRDFQPVVYVINQTYLKAADQRVKIVFPFGKEFVELIKF